MVFTILMSIVFVAELIIAFTIFSALKQLSKRINEFNLTLSYLKPSIKDICELTREISAQVVEFSEQFVNKINHSCEEFVLRKLSQIVLGAFLLRKIKKTKLIKLIGKGLSLLQIVV